MPGEEGKELSTFVKLPEEDGAMRYNTAARGSFFLNGPDNLLCPRLIDQTPG